MNPFPLQQNLKVLKPNIGKGFSWLAVLGIFGYDQLRNRIGHLLQEPAFLVAIGIAAAAVLYILAELYLRRIYFNRQGVGVTNRFGGTATWYSFDELKEAKLRRRQMPLGKPTSGRMLLEFHTGSVGIRLGLYDKKGVEELTAIIREREKAMNRLHQPYAIQRESYSPPKPKEYSPSRSAKGPSPSIPSQPTKAPSWPTSPGNSKPRSLKEQLDQWKRQGK